MSLKNILIVISIICLLGICTYKLTDKKDISTKNNNVNIAIQTDNTSNIKDNTNNKTDNKKISADAEKTLKANIQKSTEKEKSEEFVEKTNLYNETPSSVIPLSGITVISALPDNIKKTVSKISETNNIYMIQKNNDKLFIISDNPENIRHGIEFTEISLNNGHQTRTTLGYNDKIKDSENDIWEYNPETKLPTRHTKYNSTGDMEFIEVWNYDENNPVKYEMKDANEKVISIRKETLQDGTDLRVEHLLYDKDGKTRITVTATYDGQDIKRFTYYNADKINESGSIFSDYTDGLKTKETVYSSDLKLKNTYTSDYKDGNREDITVWDNQNKEIKRFIPN